MVWMWRAPWRVSKTQYLETISALQPVSSIHCASALSFWIIIVCKLMFKFFSLFTVHFLKRQLFFLPLQIAGHDFTTHVTALLPRSLGGLGELSKVKHVNPRLRRSRVCTSVSNSTNPLRVDFGICKHRKNGVTRKHWPPVHGPPLRTRSVDYLRTGPRTTPTDPSTDHPQNKIKKQK